MNRKWIIIIIGSIIFLTITTTFFIFFGTEKKFLNMKNVSEIILEVSNNNINTQNDFCELVNDALNFDNEIIIQSCGIDQNRNERVAKFSKMFERTFIQRIFSGVKRVTCNGEISSKNDNTKPCNILLKIQWRKYYDNERFEKVEDGEYDYFVDVNKIKSNIESWNNN